MPVRSKARLTISKIDAQVIARHAEGAEKSKAGKSAFFRGA